jgi:uncharacterized protein
MVGRHPEQRVARPVALQRWESLTFVHWACEPAAIEPLLPEGLLPDLYQGQAWVSLTPFLMTRARVPGMPAIPGISTFGEANVRTYVRDRSGRDGLYFLTLECARAVTLVSRPSLGLPYSWARMSVQRRDRGVRYTSSRRLPRNPAAELDVAVEIGGLIAESHRTPLDDWLTGRWRAFTGRGSVRSCVDVEHEPWPLHSATLTHCRGRLVESTGLPAPTGEPVVHFSPCVDVRLGRPHRV